MPIEPLDDGLVIPEIGPWGKQKYHFLGRYLHLFSRGMKNKWPERHYIDLFAGAGLARVRGTQEIVLTSAALAAIQEDPFTAIHCCDADKNRLSALTARLGRSKTTTTVRTHCADANGAIETILRNVPSRGALCVTFADPYGLHLDFETVRLISARQSDLIILLADNMDALRNWATIYFDDPNSSLDRFMGEPGWRETLCKSPSDQLADRLKKRYVERLRGLGYSHFGFERFRNSKGADIYSLVYASKSARGIDFWNKATQKEASGQTRLAFE